MHLRLLLTGAFAALAVAAPSSLTGAHDVSLAIELDTRGYPGAPPFDVGDVNNYVNWIVSNFMRSQATYERCIFYNAIWGNPGDRTIFYNHLNAIRDNLMGTTLYDVYVPPGSSNDPFSRDSGPRAYFDQQQLERDWFRITSRAFAQRCRGVAYLIWDRQRVFHNVNDREIWDAIWSTDEFGEIMANGQVTEIFIVNPNTGIAETTPFWTRGQPAPAVPYILTGLQWPTPPGYGNNTDASGRPAKRELDDAASISGPRHFPSVEELEYYKNFTAPPRAPASVDLSQFPGIGGPNEPLTKRQTFQYSPIEARVEDAVFTRYQNFGWAPGVCQLQFTQTIFDDGDYPSSAFNFSLYDDSYTDLIGNTDSVNIPDNGYYDLPSRLPYTVIVHPGLFSFGTIDFAYAGQNFNTSDVDRCVVSSFKGPLYEETRGGACNFTCSPV